TKMETRSRKQQEQWGGKGRTMDDDHATTTGHQHQGTQHHQESDSEARMTNGCEDGDNHATTTGHQHQGT
ncbi:hypothetical protein L208DRAFT_1390053, partial [Tricholoma matsutake]